MGIYCRGSRGCGADERCKLLHQYHTPCVEWILLFNNNYTNVSCDKKVFVREKSQSYTQCMYTGAHVAGVEDVVDEGDDDTFSHQTETERLPELPLV